MSFDNLNGIKTKKFNLGIFILFTFLALMFAILIPGPGLIGVALLPIPVSLLIIAGRIKEGIICAAASRLILLLFSYILALVAIVFIVSVAFSQRYAVEKKWPAGKMILTVFLIFLGAACLYVLLLFAIYGPAFFTETAEVYNGYIEDIRNDPFISNYASLMRVDRSQLDTAISQTQALLKFMPKILPGMFIVSFSIISLVNYLFSFMIFKRYRIEIKPFKSFIEWDLSWYFVWGVIIGLVLVLIPNMGSSIDGGTGTMNIAADILGYNLIIIFGMLYMVLGISVLWGIFERLKTGFLIRVAVVIFLLFFFGFGLIIFPALGLIDVWANFRKLKRN
ncbi:MAG: YybS family protein [Actinomycetia bacterium]|nr:YybS family protein [Actinomycetes bacterium]